MFTIQPADSPLLISQKGLHDARTMHIVGRHKVSKTTWEPVCYGGNYQMPLPADAQKLRVAAGDQEDGPTGTGARKVRLNCLDAEGNEFTETLDTAGASASGFTNLPAWRLLSFDVIESGKRDVIVGASPANVDDLVIEDGSGNEWGRIEAGIGNAEMAMTTMPAGWHGRIVQLVVNGDKSKLTRTAIYYKENRLLSGPPWDAEQHIFPQNAQDGEMSFALKYPSIPARPLSDIGVIGKTDTGTNEMTAILELVLEKRK